MSWRKIFRIRKSLHLTVTMWLCKGLWLLPSWGPWSQWHCILLWHEGRRDGLQLWTVLTGLVEQSTWWKAFVWPLQALLWRDWWWPQLGHLLCCGEWYPEPCKVQECDLNGLLFSGFSSILTGHIWRSVASLSERQTETSGIPLQGKTLGFIKGLHLLFGF